MDLTRLEVIAFAGASNWPIWAGQALGFFSDHGIDLALSLTPSSRHMARQLHTGLVDIALTSIDNVIAYNLGQGEEHLEGPVDFIAFMGVDNGLLSLMSQPGLTTVAALRGKTLAVDALTTGFAFVLREILARHGLSETDVVFVPVGTGAERLAALKSHACDATLLNMPLCLGAEQAGMVRLVNAREMLGPYQGIVGAARRAWAGENADLLRRFIAAFHSSLSWLRVSGNRAQACAILAHRMPTVGLVIDRAYKGLIENGGLTPDLRIDHRGLEFVSELRLRYGGEGGSGMDLRPCCDESDLTAALDGMSYC